MALVLYHGDNDLEIEEAARAFRGRFNPADVLTYDGAAVPLGELSVAARTAGLFDPDRLVIVHNLHERLKGSRAASESEEISALFESLAPTTTLLLVSAGVTPDHALTGLVKAAGGEVRAFMQPRKGDLGKWLVRRGKEQDVTIEPEAAELLAELVGSNPVMLQSELVKLATYAGEEARITPAMVDELVGAVPQERIFSLVDAIAAGDSASAFRLLRAQTDAASGGPMDTALYLIRMLARQMRILLGVRLGQEAGRSSAQIIADLKLPRYYADRYFRQARRLSKERLAHTFEQLAALEYGLKSGTMDAAAGLDLLVGKLCA
jgi:DNA polymerase-3 subunit delta